MPYLFYAPSVISPNSLVFLLRVIFTDRNRPVRSVSDGTVTRSAGLRPAAGRSAVKTVEQHLVRAADRFRRQRFADLRLPLDQAADAILF